MMKDNYFRTRVFLVPFLRKRFIISSVICLLAAVSTFASDDIQQTAAEDTKQMTKQADKFSKKGNYPEAEKLLRRVLTINPNNLSVKLKLAKAFLKQRKLIEAFDHSVEICKKEPKNSEAFAILGMTYLYAGNFQEAKIAVVNSLKLNRREALAWAGLGLIDFYENRIELSLERLNQAVYNEASEPDYTFAFAQVAARAERYKEAAEAYRRYLTISNDMDQDRRARIKGVIDFLSYLGNQEYLYVRSGKDQTSVKFQLVGNRPIIELKINDHEAPLRFVLDTGSGISVISDKTANRLKVKSIARGGFARGIGGDGKFEIVYGFLKTVSIGEVKIRNVPVYIRKFHTNNETIDGYIGLALISKFLTTIDYGDLSFSLTRKDSLPKNTVTGDDLSLPLRLTSSGFLSGEVQLEGIQVPLNFIVDTGASISVISDDIAGSKEISQFTQGETMRVIGAAGVTENVPSFLLPRVTFGTHTRESVNAIALDLDLINETSGFEQAGILGGNFLRNYRLTFDFDNSKVIFVPIRK